MSNKGRNNNQGMRDRDESYRRDYERPRSTLKLNSRLKFALYFILAWILFNDVILALGWWEYDSLKNSADMGYTIVNILAPVIGAVIIFVTDSDGD